MPRQGAPAPMFSMGLPTPQPLVSRPLKGIDLLTPSLQIPDGGFVDLANMMVRPRGLYKIPGYTKFANGSLWSPSDSPDLLVAAWGNDGVQRPYLLTDNYVFAVDAMTGYTRKHWTYTTGNIDTSGTAVTPHSGSTPLWKTLGILAGDIITIGASSYTIHSVNSDSSLTLATSAGTQSNVSYSIERLLNAANPYVIDADVAMDITLPNYLAIASYNQQIAMLNPISGLISNLTPSAVKQPASGGFTAECLVYFVGRIFAGHLNDGSNGEMRARIRWSKATDTTDFSDPTAYDDMISQGESISGAVRRMIPMGTMLVCYLDDAIFIGTPSNQTNLPLQFQQVPTSRVGLAGPRAIVSTVLPRGENNLWGINVIGHFFVGWDNVYFLSASNLSLEPIGDRVVAATVKECLNPWRIQAAIDWSHRRIRFGFPKSQNYIEQIWDYNWQTKEWSYENRKTWLVSTPPLDLPLTFSDFSAINYNDATWSTATFASVINNPVQRAMYIESAGAIASVMSDTAALNFDGTPNTARIETRDFDEGAPGIIKFWRRFGIKIEWDKGMQPAANINYQAYVSLDRGRSYKNVGVLTIKKNFDEGYVNFRATGPHIRFLLISIDDANTTPHYISEISRLVSIRGVEQSVQQQNAVP